MLPTARRRTVSACQNVQAKKIPSVRELGSSLVSPNSLRADASSLKPHYSHHLSRPLRRSGIHRVNRSIVELVTIGKVATFALLDTAMYWICLGQRIQAFYYNDTLKISNDTCPAISPQ